MLLSRKRSNLIAAAILWSWGILIFIAPLSISGDSLDHLDGQSNILDHREEYDGLPVIPKCVYYAGDILCHQKSSRSLYLNGNQLPVCARCTSIYVSLSVGIIITFLIPNDLDSREYVIFFMPERIKRFLLEKVGAEIAAISMMFLFLLPTAMDGGIQLVTPYESSNILRILTGLPAGLIGGILLGAILNTKKHK